MNINQLWEEITIDRALELKEGGLTSAHKDSEH